MNLKELIVKRKSIRKYDLTPLDNKTLSEIEAFVKEIKLPFEGDFSFKIINKSEYDAKTGGLYKISGPHYIMFYGKKTDDVYKNIGFAGELLALKLAGMDIGTCWLGGTTSKELIDGNDFIVCICFGKPLSKFRESAIDINRKKLNAIATGYSKEQAELLEWARLAPSAVNFQPWYFKCEQNKIHIFRKKTLFSGIAHIQTMQKIDIGIAISHLTSENFIAEKIPQKEKGLVYECTLKFN